MKYAIETLNIEICKLRILESNQHERMTSFAEEIKETTDKIKELDHAIGTIEVRASVLRGS